VLDLALALVWTPLGIGALVAAAAALACAAYLPRMAVPVACLALVLAGVAYVSALQADLATARRERDEARTAAATATAGTRAVEGVAGKVADRAKASRATRDRILTAPASDDAPVAPVLRDVLEAGR
jgi:voltage-gated potassium channel Kch